MTALEQLKRILSEKYVSEDGDDYTITLKPGLSEAEIDDLAVTFPSQSIEQDYRELLRFASGFEFYGLGEITFDGFGQFGFEEFFPLSVQLAGDGFGNFWIMDVEAKGKLGAIYYVCHDPAVIVKHSDNLSQFIKHIDEFGKEPQKSHLNIIHEETVNQVWKSSDSILDKATALATGDAILTEFAKQLPEHYVFADLRDKPIKSGFSWGKYGPDISKAKRFGSESLWAIEKVKKKSFFAKLFGR